MALSQLFWDVLMPWNLKSTYFSLKMIHFISLNIWYVIYVVFWIKYWNLKLPHHCILFLFTICTVSQLFWNRVCKWNTILKIHLVKLFFQMFAITAAISISIKIIWRNSSFFFEKKLSWEKFFLSKTKVKKSPKLFGYQHSSKYILCSTKESTVSHICLERHKDK